MSDEPLTDNELLEMPLTQGELQWIALGGNVIRPSNNIGPMAVQRMVSEIHRHRRERDTLLGLAERQKQNGTRFLELIEELVSRQHKEAPLRDAVDPVTKEQSGYGPIPAPHYGFPHFSFAFGDRSVAMTTCLHCGAAVLVDPLDGRMGARAKDLHHQWHVRVEKKP